MSKKSHLARNSSPRISFSTTSQQITSQTGLIPFVKYMGKINFDKLFEETMDHERGADAKFDLNEY
jgi:hypothetical protein